MIRPFFAKYWLTITAALTALVFFPLLVVSTTSKDKNTKSGGPTAIPTVGVSLPAHYRQDFVLYATVQRPDGTLRDVYINPESLSAIRSFYNLPDGTVMVNEGYYAAKDKDGNYLTDAQGRYVKGDPMPFIHVREKRANWSAGDFTSGARNDDWNYGSFDVKTGAVYNESLNACFLCHNTARYDFTYTLRQLYEYTQSGETVYFMCPTTGRTDCD